MRKTSQDGGDSTSITSGIEHELKKSGIMKTKRSSIKRKAQAFSHECDDGVIEPLLLRDKEKADIIKQSAKFSIAKTKTDSITEKCNDKDKLLADNKVEKPYVCNVPGITDNPSLGNGINENKSTKYYVSITAPIHSNINNMLGSQETARGIVATKTQILVEIDGSKPLGYNPSPLIFTTAKIHTDGKTMQMEPVQVTSVPIVSTIEGSVVKTGPTHEKTVSDLSKKENNPGVVWSNSSVNHNSLVRENDKVSPDSVTKANSAISDKALNNSLSEKNVSTTFPVSTSTNYSIQPQVTVNNDIASKLVTFPENVKGNLTLTTKININKQEGTLNTENIPKTFTQPQTINPSHEITKPSTENKDFTLSTAIKLPLKSTPSPGELGCKTESKVNVIGKVGTVISKESKFDGNKTIEPTVQHKPGTSQETDLLPAQIGFDVKESITKSASNSISNKHLQRQKKTQDENEPLVKTISSLTQPNTITTKKDVNEKNIASAKDNEQIKRDSNDTNKNVSVNNVSRITTTSTPTTSTVQSATNKPITTSIKPLSKINTSIPSTASTTVPPNSATIKLLGEGTASAIPKPTSTLKSTTVTSNSSNTVKPTSKTKPSSSIVPISTSSKTTTTSKVTTASSSQSIKQSIVSTALSTTASHASVGKSVVSTINGGKTTTSSKPPTVSTTSKVLDTKSNVAKPMSSQKAHSSANEATKPAMKSSITNKNVNPKSNENKKEVTKYKEEKNLLK